MTDLLKDRQKVGLVLACLFFLGVVLSLYAIYSIPAKLMLTHTFHPALNSAYVFSVITFMIGGFGLWYTLGHQNELIVFKEKEKTIGEQDASNTHSGQTTISLETVRSAVQSARGKDEVLSTGLQAVCRQLDAGQGAVYASEENESGRTLELKGGYALSLGENATISFTYGEGLVGQAAKGARTLYLDEIPEGYIKIISGLGSASPRHLLIVPVMKESKVFGVLEIASFSPITEDQRRFVEETAQLMAGRIATT